MDYFRIKIYGIVQGVGFRPFISRLFQGCRGSVKNCGSYVDVLLKAATEKEQLRNRIIVNAPKRAEIVDIQIQNLSKQEYQDLLSEDIPERGESGKSFFIAKSPEEKPAGEPVFIPPDLAVCDDCARELYDPSNRRYLHPFINCTQCGPRLTIIDSLPYDRYRTSMKIFPMCGPCGKEYTDPHDRRYDAQPVCCNDCGPKVYFLKHDSKSGPEIESHDADYSKITRHNADYSKITCHNADDYEISSRNGDAITQARRALINGEIIAVKGIGGFHLYCDASNENAVTELRRRKGRPAKPFAVMAKNLLTVKKICVVGNDAQTELLTGHRKPIVLLEKRAVSQKNVADSVAPENDSLGVMLPYAPLQLLLFSYPDGLDEKMPEVLVATSANRSGGVICRTEEEVEKTLGNVCDAILSHDREILTRADDSVVDFFEEKPYMIRRSRGYAPLPVTVTEKLFDKNVKTASEPSADRNSDDILAFGGELKNTFCIGKGRLLYPSSYIGDLSDLNSDRALEETVERFLRMLDAHPAVVVCDKHPSYRSRACAVKFVENHPGTRLVEVQHHYAHVLSVMAENHFYDKVIGVSYDGTGYGDDGTIWGGEIFLCDVKKYRRVWHISPFIFSGGDVSAREGFRVALSMLFDKYKTEEIYDIIKRLDLCDEKYVKPLRAMHDTGINSVMSTSCGRLFDAVSAVLGICRSASYEGEASMGLETAAERYLRSRNVTSRYADDLYRKVFLDDADDPCGNENDLCLDVTDPQSTSELFYRIVDAKLAGGDSGKLAFYFHRELARITVEEALKVRSESGCAAVALSGGCFQNTLLLALTKNGLEKNGFKVLTAHEIPPNDGGISLGQCLKGKVCV